MRKMFPALMIVSVMVLTSCISGKGLGGLWKKPEKVSTQPERETPEKQVVVKKQPKTEKAPSPKKPVKTYRTTRKYEHKSGIVTAQTLNVRAGGNLNYEILTTLQNGDEVEIRGEEFGWYEIILPVQCYGWMHSDYVDITQKPPAAGRIRGKVTGDSVRVRTKPMLKCTVFTTLDSDARVVVVDVKGDWYKIELPEECSGWVSTKHVNILSH